MKIMIMMSMIRIESMENPKLNFPTRLTKKKRNRILEWRKRSAGFYLTL